MAKMANRSETPIKLDTADEVCRPFGFLHGERAINPKTNAEVIIKGVAPDPYDKNHKKVLWYEIIHPKTTGVVCCYEGATNLREAGFIAA